MYICVCVCALVCVYMCVRVCVNVNVSVCVGSCICFLCVYKYVCVCVCVSACVFVCVCLCVYSSFDVFLETIFTFVHTCGHTVIVFMYGKSSSRAHNQIIMKALFVREPTYLFGFLFAKMKDYVIGY